MYIESPEKKRKKRKENIYTIGIIKGERKIL